MLKKQLLPNFSKLKWSLGLFGQRAHCFSMGSNHFQDVTKLRSPGGVY